MSQQPSALRRLFTQPSLGRTAPVLLACAALVPAPTPGLLAQGSPHPAAPVPALQSAAASADLLLLSGDEEAAFALLASRLELAPDDFEARWRAVRIATGLSVTGSTHGVRVDWSLAADEHGQELLRVRPHDLEALAWAAAARGRRAMNEEGMRGPARLARDVWDLTERILAEQPDHPLGNHVRGKLSQQVAALPTAARLFGRLFLGSDLVGRGTWARAEEHHRRAVAADPGNVYFYLDLGETCARQGKAAQAAEAWRQGMQVPVRFPFEAGFQELMARRLEVIEGH